MSTCRYFGPYQVRAYATVIRYDTNKKKCAPLYFCKDAEVNYCGTTSHLNHKNSGTMPSHRQTALLLHTI